MAAHLAEQQQAALRAAKTPVAEQWQSTVALPQGNRRPAACPPSAPPPAAPPHVALVDLPLGHTAHAAAADAALAGEGQLQARLQPRVQDVLSLQQGGTHGWQAVPL